MGETARLFFWWVIHNAVAHPLMVFPFDWTRRFHDWTAERMR